MLELHKTKDIPRGEILLMCNDEDSYVINDFLQQAKTKKILQFITIGDINKIAKDAERIQEKKLIISINQSEVVPAPGTAKVVKANIGKSRKI